MTRLRNKNKQQAAKDPEDHASSPRHNPHQRRPPSRPMARGPDFAESFLHKNWKQQALVRVGDGAAIMTAVILAGQVLACGGLGLFAAINVSLATLSASGERDSA